MGRPMSKGRFDICVIGGGPAGLMAALEGARQGLDTVLLEKNTAPGRKLLVTGGGRCNITNMLKPADFLRACRPYERFLRHSIYSFPPQALISFLAENGLETEVLGDGCVFPASQRAYDVLDVLVNACKRQGVKFICDRAVNSIEKAGGMFVIACNKGSYESKKVVIAAGGASWPQTGSTGDGYDLAQSLGHTIVTPKACLVPLDIREAWISRLAGVSLTQVSLYTRDNKKHSISGPLVFTDTGIGGPAVLNFSRQIVQALESSEVKAFIDILPTVPQDELAKRVNQSILKNPKSQFYNLLREYVPRSLGNILAEIIGISPRKLANQLLKQERFKLVSLLKALPVTIIGTRPIETATVTRGGVANDEIDSKTMASKLCENLYLCGEVMDVDGPCGGYNLQIAFSTGRLAGLTL